MLETRRRGWKPLVATVLILASFVFGALGFATEATYTVALVGSFFWLGSGILTALLAVGLLLLDR